jgi:hypothetical protein
MFARAKINAPSISSPMRCHSVASGNCEPDDAVEYASFSINHMMPSFAFTMAQGRQHSIPLLKGGTL